MKLKATGLQNVLLGYICLWATAPPLAYGGLFRLAVLMAALSWLAIEAARPEGIIRRPTLPVLLAFFYIFYVSFVEVLYHGASGVLRNLQIFIALFFLVVQQSRRHAPETLLPVFWLILLTLPIWYMISLNVLWSENSRAARILVRSGAEAQALSARGIGGYALVYGAVLATPALLSLVLRFRHISDAGLPRILRTIPAMPFLIVSVNVGLGSLFVLNAGYSIAVILLCLGCFAVLMMRTFNPVKMLLFLLVAAVSAFFAKEMLETVLTAMLPLAEGMNFQLKIKDVLASLQVDEAVGTLSDRTERYARSFTLFIQSPLIGTLSFDDIGKHSQILDDFAQFGIVIGSVFTFLSLFLPGRYLRTNGHQFGAALGTLCAILLLFSLNNAFAGTGVSIYILFPSALCLLGLHRSVRWSAQ